MNPVAVDSPLRACVDSGRLESPLPAPGVALRAIALAAACLVTNACSAPVSEDPAQLSVADTSDAATPASQNAETPEQRVAHAAAGLVFQIDAWPTLLSGTPDDIRDPARPVRVSPNVPRPWQWVFRFPDGPQWVAGIAVFSPADPDAPSGIAVSTWAGDTPLDRAFYAEFLRLSSLVGHAALPRSDRWVILTFPDPVRAHAVWIQPDGQFSALGARIDTVRILTTAHLRTLQEFAADRFDSLPLLVSGSTAPPRVDVPSVVPSPVLDPTPSESP